MPLLDLVCIGWCEVVFGATDLGLEAAVGKERLVVYGGMVVFGVMAVSGGRFNVLGNDGGSMDVKIREVLSYLGTEVRVVDIGSWDGNNDWVGLLDKGDEKSLSKDAETETRFLDERSLSNDAETET